MARNRVQYTCQECGHSGPSWEGRCSGCGAWNTMVEEILSGRPSLRVASAGAAGPGQAPPLALADIDFEQSPRMNTGLSELDLVLGGGLVAGSMVLLGGDPGIGKSTLVMQVCLNLARRGQSVLYVSGEESLQQVRMRADRLGDLPPDLRVLAETDVEQIVAAGRSLKPQLLVIDSIQTAYRTDLSSAPGSVAQVRECAAELMRYAKSGGPAVVLVGHVTKEGALAGPRVLEHLVDAVLQMEGDAQGGVRLLYGTKNRFGAVGELGLFEMTGAGLVPVTEAGRLFVDSTSLESSGTAVLAALQGSRPILVEVQALVAATPFGLPRRTVNGIDGSRLHMLLAVLERRAGMRLGQSDVFVNVAGGIRLGEPAADLGVALAIVGNQRDLPLSPGTVVVGEVGLTGEVRAVPQLERRLAEASRLGFRRAIVPAPAIQGPDGMEMVAVRTVNQALEASR